MKTNINKIIIPQEEPIQIKCYCGHTIFCDCSPLEEPKEISDEEIEKAVMDSMDYVYLNPNDSLIFHQGWMRAIKWYREQLKQPKKD